MAEEIKLCNARYVSLQSDLDLAALIFTDFGKGRIKIGKCSPDAFVQMAIQLANYKVSHITVMLLNIRYVTCSRHFKIDVP